jgi:pimeloyl-ACP methyl ester carboxylesterase
VSVFLANGVTKADRKAFEHTPQEYSLPFEDVAFTTRGSEITLEGWYSTHPEAATTIIFVHGLGSNRLVSGAVALASRLWQQGFSTLLFDLRGHGTSDDGKVSGGYFEQNDLLGAYDFLMTKGVASEDIGVIGFSMGAATSVLGVCQEPEIRALVADSPFANASDLIAQEVSRKTPVPKWIVPLFIPGTELASNLLHGIKLGELDPESAVGDIDYPILLIHGTEDTRIPVDQGIRVHAAAHPDSGRWLVPGVDHVDAFLTYPDEYTERVVAYFRGRLEVP